MVFLSGKFYYDRVTENERMLTFLEYFDYPIIFFNFFSKLQTIKKHNKLYEQGKVSFKLGINHLSDLVNKNLHNIFKFEFQPPREYKKLNGLRYDPTAIRNATQFREPMNVGDVPESVDWRTKGFVTPVKDQAISNINPKFYYFRANAVLAGHSVPLARWKVNTSVSLDN